MESAVSVKNLSKKYKLYEDKWGPIKEIVSKKKLHKEFLALNNVSIDFPKGEAIGVLGKNGSGKSTLLKIITGIAEPSEGEVIVDGSLVFLDVSSGIDAELTGYDNIFMKGILLGFKKEEMLEKVDDIIEFSELGEFINQPVKSYSSGMRAKLGFAISVNVDPDILIVDEALAVGDSTFRKKCMNKMNEFRNNGKTIIFVSHDKNAVQSFCSKAAWINKGELITFGDSKAVCSYYNEFMSGRKTIETIQSEIQFKHSIEKVSYSLSKDSLVMSIKGFLIDSNKNHNSFQFALKNNRTGELLTEGLVNNDEKNDIFVEINSKESSSFFQPDVYSFIARYKNKGKWIEFPLWAGEAVIDHQQTTSESVQSNFSYEVKQENDQLTLIIENRETVQQQVNKLRLDEDVLNIEGVAFVRGYSTEAEDKVGVAFHLINLSSFKKYSFDGSIGYTEEITENPSFNPQGKNYNYSNFKFSIDLSALETGFYECKMTYLMKDEPNYELVIPVWASKTEDYDIGLQTFSNGKVDIQNETKYLRLDISKNK